MDDNVPSAAALLREHLRDHLTDGFWHDRCRYCLRRRRFGGTGAPVAAQPEGDQATRLQVESDPGGGEPTID